MADGEDTEQGPWSEETVKAAREWVDGLSSPSGLKGAWRLMTLDERVSILPDGTRKSRPTRLTRFAKGCPLPLMPAAEKYLLGIAPYTGLIFNGVPLEGTYKPTRTRWVRDDQWSQDEPRRPNENRHTLVQDLMESTAPDVDGVVQSDDCVELVAAEYHWNEASPPDDPGQSSQGVAVSLQQVHRAEDGTYSYVVVTRTAKTRVGVAAEVECTKFRRVVQQDFTNLYGSPEDGFADGDGTAVSVPPMSCGGDGTVVEWRNLRQNDDCTWNLSAVTTSGVHVDGVERTSRETTVELRDSVRDTAEAGPLGHVRGQDAATGTVWEQRSEMRPDGLYDNTVSKVVEKTLEGQVVERRRTVRGTTERIVNRHMRSAAPAPEGLGSVTNTVTDSGRIDQEITRVWHTDPLDAGAECRTTVFEHQEADRTIRPEKPPRHYREAGEGRRYERTSRITEEGSFDVTETETVELPVAGSTRSWRKTLRGVRETTVDRNAARALDGGNLQVGDERQSEMTPGGLWNNTTVTFSKEPVGVVGSDCQTTVFEHQHSGQENVAERPAEEAPGAGGGRTYRKTSRQTEEGTWDVTTVETEELPKPGSAKSWRKTLRGVRETTVDRNAARALDGGNLQVGDERQSEMTPGGLWNNTTVTFSKEPVGEIGEACQATAVTHVHSSTENVASKPSVEQGTVGPNVEKSMSARETEEGTWDVETRTTTFNEFPDTEVASVDNPSQSESTHVFQNLVETPRVEAGAGKSVNISVSRNEHGSYDGRYTVVTGKPFGEVEIARADNDSQTVEFHTFQNLGSAPDMTAGKGQEISASVSRNSLGLFDGSFRRVTGKPFPETLIAQAVNAQRTTEFWTFQNLPSVSPIEAGENEEISASVNRNSLGLFDGSYRKEIHSYDSATVVSSFVPELRTDKVEYNVANYSSLPEVENGYASVEINGHGSATIKTTTFTPQPVESGWLTWRSRVKKPGHVYYFENGVYIFTNYAGNAVRSLISGLTEHEASVRVSVNRYGLFDGEVRYHDLDEWEIDSSGGGEGGIRSGSVTVPYVEVNESGDSDITTTTKTFTVPVVTYIGTGNEGDEASARVNQYIIPGLKLPNRTYATGMGTAGEYLAAAHKGRNITAKAAERRRMKNGGT